MPNQPFQYSLPAVRDTLAAAYAEVDQFDQVVETAQRVLQLAQKAGKRELAEDILDRIELYNAKRPYGELFTSQDRSNQRPKE